MCLLLHSLTYPTLRCYTTCTSLRVPPAAAPCRSPSSHPSSMPVEHCAVPARHGARTPCPTPCPQLCAHPPGEGAPLPLCWGLRCAYESLTRGVSACMCVRACECVHVCVFTHAGRCPGCPLGLSPGRRRARAAAGWPAHHDGPGLQGRVPGGPQRGCVGPGACAWVWVWVCVCWGAIRVLGGWLHARANVVVRQHMCGPSKRVLRALDGGKHMTARIPPHCRVHCRHQNGPPPPLLACLPGTWCS